MNAHQPIASYTELIAGINAYREALGVRLIDFDELAGFAPGLSGKAFGPAMVKRLGSAKLFDALRAAGLALRIEPDPKQLERMCSRIGENCQTRQANQARPNNQAQIANATIELALARLAKKKGGITRLNRAVKEARSNIARQAADARWQRRRQSTQSQGG